MDFNQKKIDRYCSVMSSDPGTILKELERETQLKTLAPQMLTGHVQGNFLQILSQMIQPKCILEIGTFTGYSAICMAQGLQEGGVLHTIEINRERLSLINKYLNKANLLDKVQIHVGDALAIIPKLKIAIDLCFIDAAKFDYINYYNLIIDKMVPGGIIIADNVLWSGKVIDNFNDEDTQTLRKFNELIKDDKRVENVLLPVRDGINLIRVK